MDSSSALATAHAVCLQCDKSLTLPSIIFILIIFVGTAAFYFLFRNRTKSLLLKLFIMMVSVAIFELYTAPMWDNHHLGEFGYIYLDVSWILNLGWSALILSVILFVDGHFKRYKAWQRFFIYQFLLLPVVLIIEAIVFSIGVRTLSPEVWNSISGLIAYNLPVEALYYIPVFTMLIISFYKYWSFHLDNVLVTPQRRIPLLRRLFLLTIAVVLFELMIEPIVSHANLPAWSYFYKDTSLLMSGAWILLAWCVLLVVDKYFIHINIRYRFVIYIVAASAFGLGFEAFLLNNGYLLYGQSMINNFSGFTSPLTRLPIEVAFAIPMYFALIVAFARYWEIILDNKT